MFRFDIVGMGVLIAGPGAAGTVFQGFTVENAPAEGILAAMTSDVALLHNELKHNDQAAFDARAPSRASVPPRATSRATAVRRSTCCP